MFTVLTGEGALSASLALGAAFLESAMIPSLRTTARSGSLPEYVPLLLTDEREKLPYCCGV